MATKRTLQKRTSFPREGLTARDGIPTREPPLPAPPLYRSIAPAKKGTNQRYSTRQRYPSRPIDTLSSIDVLHRRRAGRALRCARRTHALRSLQHGRARGLDLLAHVLELVELGEL
eukprot:7337943-Prymnesium_polylepis.1